jgi:hypothetical protein
MPIEAKKTAHLLGKRLPFETGPYRRGRRKKRLKLQSLT